MTTETTKVRTPQIGRDILIRKGTSDFQVWADTFSGLYHLPPEEMPVPKTVLDLGANIGLTAAHYRYLWPNAEIVAVEMDEENHRLAEWNAPDVRHAHAAVGTSFGVGYYDPRAESFALTLSDLAEAMPGFRFVSRYALNDMIRSLLGGFCDFVKMDVEGEEWKLLADLPSWAPLVGHVLVELHGPDPHEAMLRTAIEQFEAAGFHACHHTRHPIAVYAWK